MRVSALRPLSGAAAASFRASPLRIKGAPKLGPKSEGWCPNHWTPVYRQKDHAFDHMLAPPGTTIVNDIDEAIERIKETVRALQR